MRRFKYSVVIAILALIVSHATADDPQKTYQELDRSPLWAFTYAELDQFLQERVDVVGGQEALGDAVGYWARKQLGTAVDITMADLTGVSSQYLVQRAVALACARSLREYYAILSLMAFKDGKISWTYANIDIEEELIPGNSWIWENVTRRCASSPKDVGRYFKPVNPRAKIDRAALEKGELSDLYCDGAKRLAIPEIQYHDGAYIRKEALQPSQLKVGDMLFVVSHRELSPEKTRGARDHVNLEVYTSGAIRQCCVVVEDDGRQWRVPVVTTSGSASGMGIKALPLDSILMHIEVLGVVVVRLREDARSLSRLKASSWLAGAPVPDFDALDAKFASLRRESQAAQANGKLPVKRYYESMLVRSLGVLWFDLTDEQLKGYGRTFGICRASNQEGISGP